MIDRCDAGGIRKIIVQIIVLFLKYILHEIGRAHV